MACKNVYNHLFEDHRISASEEQQKSKAELAVDTITKNVTTEVAVTLNVGGKQWTICTERGFTENGRPN